MHVSPIKRIPPRLPYVCVTVYAHVCACMCVFSILGRAPRRTNGRNWILTACAAARGCAQPLEPLRRGFIPRQRVVTRTSANRHAPAAHFGHVIRPISVLPAPSDNDKDDEDEDERLLGRYKREKKTAEIAERVRGGTVRVSGRGGDGGVP